MTIRYPNNPYSKTVWIFYTTQSIKMIYGFNFIVMMARQKNPLKGERILYLLFNFRFRSLLLFHI